MQLLFLKPPKHPGGSWFLVHSSNLGAPMDPVPLSRPPGQGMEWFCARHSLLLHFSVTMYDYQAMCKPPDHHHSAAESLISVSVVTAGLSSPGAHPLPSP